MVEYHNWLPERLAQLRMQKGVSARDMSLSLGQSESYINKIENRRTLPPTEGFFYICEYLDITPQDFFNDSLSAPKQSKALLEAIDRLGCNKREHILQLVTDLLE